MSDPGNVHINFFWNCCNRLVIWCWPCTFRFYVLCILSRLFADTVFSISSFEKRLLFDWFLCFNNRFFWFLGLIKCQINLKFFNRLNTRKLFFLLWALRYPHSCLLYLTKGFKSLFISRLFFISSKICTSYNFSIQKALSNLVRGRWSVWLHSFIILLFLKVISIISILLVLFWRALCIFRLRTLF